MSSERSFFSAMEEFGFFSHIYEKLPPDFTAVFEIARVFEDETNQLTRELRDVLRLPAAASSSKLDTIDDPHRYSPVGDEYEADLIRSHHDVARIYPAQFLLPDEIFLERLAQRELWMPVAKDPHILPIEEFDQGFRFDSRKQKVYILFDTSASMSSHHRIHLAKAIVYHFLKENKSELGFISFRTFDDHVGDLHTAVDQGSYDALMRYVLRISHLGEGTVLQKALLQALDDIQSMEHLSGAEILVITDGAVSIDREAIGAKMDENILIHSIKIGHAQIYASEAQLNDMITYGKVKDRALMDLEKQLADVDHRLRSAPSPNLQNLHNGLRAQVAARRAELSKDIQAVYGHELRLLSKVYVNVDDFNETDRFRADEATISDLAEIAYGLEEEAKEFFTPELTKKLAILHDHVQFLLKYETDPALRDKLKEIDDHLRKLLSEFMGAPSEPTPGDQTNADATTSAAPVHIPLSEEDMQDLKFLLEADLSMGGDWGKLLKWMWQQAVRAVTKWKWRK